MEKIKKLCVCLIPIHQWTVSSLKSRNVSSWIVFLESNSFINPVPV